MMSAPKGNQGIYKIVSPSKRIYVGQSVDIKQRFCRYKGLHCKGQRRLYASFNKYGVDAHEFCIIEIVENFDLMLEKERHWQVFYKTTGVNGLNCKIVSKNATVGRHSEETKKLMSLSAKGRTHKPESKEKMRLAKIGRKMPEEQRLKMIGRKISINQIEKTRARMMGNQHTVGMTPVNAKKVICTVTGAVFKKVSEAADYLNIKPSTLSAKLRGQNKNNTTMRYA